MERANFFVHFVGWGGEKTGAYSEAALGFGADSLADVNLWGLVSFCCLYRDFGDFLIFLSWEIYRDFREDTYLRSLLERVVEARKGKV